MDFVKSKMTQLLTKRPIRTIVGYMRLDLS